MNCKPTPSGTLKVGFFAGHAEKAGRGIPVATRTLLNNLAEVPESDLQVDLLHFKDLPLTQSFGFNDAAHVGVPIRKTAGPWLKLWQEQVRFPLFQLRQGYDVVVHPHNHGQLPLPRVGSHRSGYVMMLHDVLPLDPASKRFANEWDSKKEALLYLSRVKTARFADRVIVPSEHARQAVIRFTKTDPAKVTVVPWGIDHSRFNTNVDGATLKEVRAKYDLPNKFLLTVGGYTPHKNLHTLIDAYAMSDLPKKGIGLVLVGPKDNPVYAPIAHEVEAHIEKLGLTHLTRAIGLVPDDELVAIQNLATVFGIASHYEGFGFPPLEAMACGTPVVASRVSSIPEVLGNAALYADPNDPRTFAKQFNVLADPATRAQYREKGLARAQQFQWSTTAARLAEIVAEVGAEAKLSRRDRRALRGSPSQRDQDVFEG
ncbi:MAG: glycosyltransferase family 4 protein [Archangiaceae bacterium]|nr:glycosyltransferase family 4 protein [Archangiaceae bacterium]